jgi:aminoglycoside 6'-N-acetyltransferase I
MRIMRATPADLPLIGPLRSALWPDSDPAELDEIAARIAGPAPDHLVLIAQGEGAAIGFAEVALRRDYVNGCEGSPVAFLEGIYVDKAYRRRGIARALADAASEWGNSRGAAEFASDALLDNSASHAFHAALGFEETERVVYFRRLIAGAVT